MSSSDAYSSSSGGGESSEEEPPAARAPAGTQHRGATPRGAARARTTTARRNPKRYTTAEMDAEIALYKENSDESSSSSEDEDDDDAFVEEGKPAAKAKRGAPAKKASPRRRSGYKPPKPKKKPAKKKKPPAKKSPAKGRKRPAKKDSFIADSDDEEEASPEESSDEESEEEYMEDASDASDGDENDDSDSDFGAPAKQRGTTKPYRKAKSPRARATPSRSTRSTRATYQEHSSDEDEDEEIEYDTTPTGTRRPRRHCKSQSEQKIRGMVARDMQSEREALGDMLEDDDKELLENSGGDDGGSGSSEEEGAPRGSGKRLALKAAKKKSTYDDDDSYDEAAPEEEEEEEEDEMSEYDEEEEDEDLALPTRRSTRASPRKKARPAYKDVDASDVGTAEEDSEDEATRPSLLMSPAKQGAAAVGSYGSPNVRQRARRGRTPLDVREEDGGSDGGDSEEGRKTKPERKRRKFSADSDSDEGGSSDEEGDAGEAKSTPRHALLKSPCRQINCPSTIDDITMAPLPTTKPHVCYVAPDGKTRHCFALDTLYRIAITSKAGDDPTISVGTKLKFLQPPHFRSPIEPDLEDQIASRFGRGALVIEKSAMYKKMKGLSVAGMDDELDDFDEDGEYVGHDAARSANFTDRFQRYMQSLMGSADVYCCPLCYNEADRRLGNNDPEMWEDDESDGEGNGTEDRHGSEDHFKFLDDPLTILGSLDGERLEVASSFCFRLMKDVKTHLRVVHGVKVSDVAGNDLYKRFQIRTGDGLLQSWLKKSLGHSTVQGDMMRYWLNGENQSFILLLDQIDRGRMRGEHSGEYGSAFSRSFPHRARRVWRDVSAPYLKDTQDMGDFIADEGEEASDDDDDGAVPVNPHFTPPGEKGEQKMSPMEQMIDNLKKKNRARGVFDNSDASLAEESDDSDVLEVLPRGPQHDEEEEEDEWTKSKSYKAKKNKKGKRSQDSDDDGVFDSDAEKPKPKAPTNGSARKVIGDGAGIDSEDEAESKPKAQMNGSARKRVIDSDEESY